MSTSRDVFNDYRTKVLGWHRAQVLGVKEVPCKIYNRTGTASSIATSFNSDGRTLSGTAVNSFITLEFNPRPKRLNQLGIVVEDGIIPILGHLPTGVTIGRNDVIEINITNVVLTPDQTGRLVPSNSTPKATKFIVTDVIVVGTNVQYGQIVKLSYNA